MAFPFQIPVLISAPSFSVETVVQTGDATLQIIFTEVPLAVSGAGAHDALNVTNYTLSGPATLSIMSAAKVVGVPHAIALLLNGPLTTGTWTLTGSTQIQTPSAVSLGTPRGASFSVSVLANTVPFNGGRVDNDAFDILRKHLSPALQGPGITALLTGLAAGDEDVFANGEAVFDQLFVSSASGIYLDRKLSDDGIRRPPGIGMADPVFSDYGISINAH